MEIEFDTDKDAINRFKHRLPLAFGKRVFDDAFVSLTPTIRIGDEEERWKAVGYVDTNCTPLSMCGVTMWCG